MIYEFEVDLKPVRPRPEPQSIKEKTLTIRKTLVLAYQIADYMQAHEIKTLKDFCARANITKARATQIMRLLQLSPKIQEEILLEENPAFKSINEHYIRHLTKEVIWSKQESIWDRYKSTGIEMGSPIS